jgi:hypothetical protein
MDHKLLVFNDELITYPLCCLVQVGTGSSAKTIYVNNMYRYRIFML